MTKATISLKSENGGLVTTMSACLRYSTHSALLKSPSPLSLFIALHFSRKETTSFVGKYLGHAEIEGKDYLKYQCEIGEDMEESLTQLVKKYMPGSNYYFAKDLYNKLRFLYIVDQGGKKDA